VRFITSDRGSATLLLAAAALALILAATPFGPTLLAVRDLHLPVEGIGLHLTVEHLISDGLLAVFFFLVAIELRHELTHGSLAHPAAAVVPAIAAIGGVAAPAGIYLLIAGGTEAGGWPIPTATDIAFALGLLALLGRGLPARVRAFLLALAILDDLVAILLIAIVFPGDLQPLLLVTALVPLAAFVVVARRMPQRLWLLRAIVLWVLGLAVWYVTLLAGVHATLAGVALGLVLPAGLASTADRVLQPVSRGAILPLFAFSASLIRLEGGVALDPVLLGVAVALPIGKVVGIVVAGVIAGATVGRRAPDRLPVTELLAVGLVSGVGFTVSLLMAQLAFASSGPGTAATLGVLVGSLAAIVLSAVVVPLIARRARAAVSRPA
jgi:NhaA family Na+:H+ antiporter